MNENCSDCGSSLVRFERDGRLETMETFDRLAMAMEDALGDLRILAGDVAGPRDVTWHDVAGTAAINLQTLAAMLDSLRRGETHFRGVPWKGAVCFPSPDAAGR